MQREKEDRIKAEAEGSDYRMQEHMAALNFHRSMSTTEKQPWRRTASSRRSRRRRRMRWNALS